ncbi:MAG: hypothetical protein OH319_04170 [Candidatus Parvarchaeota archaeon]|nr:hypothetical protein [Candidatus Jingweiarchaeum tengchongense]MCW1298017.1 hypothetical protein [Candidatus Jingweiarchaeum tengchongense]MCW1300183.1 hypothetical protein [Candidatus Jingweiarchaeum tengchongense]MCW1304393.1 hypothetical protein [Candidatus Jingweiarchaeum tengchongense]MCW1310945.1 hypothetical protein [Candidatus Jingweiarchaeum tengchongense]
MKKEIFSVIIIILALFFLSPILCNMYNTNQQTFALFSVFCTINDAIINFISWAQQGWVITIAVIILIILVFIAAGIHFSKSGF